jgi:hypothetical protein
VMFESKHRNSLAQRLASIVAKPAVCSCAMSGRQKVLAHYIALLLAGRCRGSKSGGHGLSNEIVGVVMAGRGEWLSVHLLAHQRKQCGTEVKAVGL